MRLIDRTGQKFGRLTITKEIGNKLVEAVCTCGVVKNYNKGRVVCGKTSSCGCYQKEVASSTHGKHRMSTTKLNKVYRGMKTRCYTPTSTGYYRYGGRGIIICDEWLKSFESFASFAFSNGYKEGLQIDRIDNDGNYEPGNCQFVSGADNCASGKRGIRSDNTSGIVGVREYRKGIWVAYYTANKLTKKAKFRSKEEAIAQRLTWEKG